MKAAAAAAAAAWLALGAGAQAQVALTAAPAAPATAVPAETAKGGYTAEERRPLPAEAEHTLQQINAHRARGATCGSRTMPAAPPLAWNEVLQRAADVQARHMGRIGDVTHDGSDGSSVGTRVTREGYTWGAVGENAAAGRPTAEATLLQWMDSPGHCGNLMNAAFREVAVVGVNAGGRYGTYWVMVLAALRR